MQCSRLGFIRGYSPVLHVNSHNVPQKINNRILNDLLGVQLEPSACSTVIRRAPYASLYHFRHGLLYLLLDHNARLTCPDRGPYFPTVVSPVALSGWQSGTQRKLLCPAYSLYVSHTIQLSGRLLVVIDLAGQ